MTASNDLASPQLKNNVVVKIIVIQNRNYAPVFEKKNYAFNVSENAAIGSTVGSVSATDVNKVRTVNFVYNWNAHSAAIF